MAINHDADDDHGDPAGYLGQTGKQPLHQARDRLGRLADEVDVIDRQVGVTVKHHRDLLGHAFDRAEQNLQRQ